MSEISARCFLFVGNISATICKNLIFKIFYLVRKVFLICAKSDIKSIKNAIIKEALKLNLTEDEVEKNENTDEEPVLNPFEYEENTSAESVFDSDKGVLYPHYSIKTNRNSVAVSSLYLLRYLCNIIQNQLRFEEKQKAQRTDKKLQQKINDKKQAQGVKM